MSRYYTNSVLLAVSRLYTNQHWIGVSLSHKRTFDRSETLLLTTTDVSAKETLLSIVDVSASETLLSKVDLSANETLLSMMALSRSETIGKVCIDRKTVGPTLSPGDLDRRLNDTTRPRPRDTRKTTAHLRITRSKFEKCAAHILQDPYFTVGRFLQIQLGETCSFYDTDAYDADTKFLRVGTEVCRGCGQAVARLRQGSG